MAKNSPPLKHASGPPKVFAKWVSAKKALDAAVAKLPPKAQEIMAEYTTAEDEATHRSLHGLQLTARALSPRDAVPGVRRAGIRRLSRDTLP